VGRQGRFAEGFEITRLQTLEKTMLKTFATSVILAAGVAVAAPAFAQDARPVDEPTIDVNGDGVNDAWDRDEDGFIDAWDDDADGQPDVVIDLNEDEYGYNRDGDDD